MDRIKTGWHTRCGHFTQTDGTAAIEFSLLAVPFIFFVLGIIELSILFLNDAVLNGAVYDAARMIRTGEVQQSDDPETAFREALCDHASLLMNCNALEYRVETLEAFAQADTDLEVDEDGHMNEEDFETGGVSDIVMIRVTYLYPLMTPMIGAFFSDYPNNKKLLMATTVLQAEPYSFEEEE